MRPSLMVLALLLGSALPAAALPLKFPVRRAGETVVSRGPAYAGDVLEVRLTPEAARVAYERNTGGDRIEALGPNELDRLSDELGVWFQPEFVGETPPPPGSRQPDFTAFYVAHLPEHVRLEDALERFRSLRSVASVSPIAILPVDAVTTRGHSALSPSIHVPPNDSLWAFSHWFYQPANEHHIHAPQAWNVTTGDTSIVVAILDTGVVPYHPDLAGRVAGLSGNIWTNWKEAAGTPNVDDDGNFKKDDVHGWDFVLSTVDWHVNEDHLTEDNDPNDYSGHGTEVAGLVAALTDNTIGVAGTAPTVRIMPLRMGWSYGGNPPAPPGGGEVSMVFAAAAIRYATRMGAHVINCSWESDFTFGLEMALTAAVDAGITVVSASGNVLSQPHYIGDRDDCLAIAATDANDVITSFSVLGPYVDLAAPGQGMSSTFVVDLPGDSISNRTPAYRSGIQGTSFSTPLVSGVVALIQSQYVKPYSNHLLTPRGIQLRLMETADDISAQNPFLAGQYGAGRLNAFRALTETSGSTATRTLAGSVGASALIPSTGESHVAFLADDQRLIQIEPATQDTVMDLPTQGTPVGDVAAADLGPGIGPGLFYATSDAGVFGVAADGAALPGSSWPQPAIAPPVMTAPALGDLDGDGSIEVVSAGNDGQLFAWHADGSSLTGFPFSTGASPLNTAPALSDLDGTPGAEIIVAALDGTVHAYTFAAAELTHWPVSTGALPRPPVVLHLGTDPAPAVVVAAGNQLYAFSSAGDARSGFPATLSGGVTQDLAIADVDGNGYDDIVLVTPGAIDVRDSAGVSLGALGWPRSLPGSIEGPPVLGELSTTSAGPEVLVMVSGSLRALERDGDLLATLPKPGGAGSFPSIGQADADAAAEIIAGCGTDSLFYIYDAGSGSTGAGPNPWPTPRANYARTGSRLYAPPIGGLSGIPAQVTTLEATGSDETSVSLRWTASGDDGLSGRPRIYAVHASTAPLDAGNFASAPFQRDVPATVDGGGTETYVFRGLGGATTYFFALVAVDGANFSSPLSNVIEAGTGSSGPLSGRTGATVVVAPQPALGTASLHWLGAAGALGSRQTISIYDLTGRRRRVIEVGGGATGVVTWDGRDDQGRFVPAGLYQARLVSGSVHTEARIVLLR